MFTYVGSESMRVGISGDLCRCEGDVGVVVVKMWGRCGCDRDLWGMWGCWLLCGKFLKLMRGLRED